MDEKPQYLQAILGTGKGNPSFTVFRHADGKLHVYYGLELLEIVPSDRDSASYKLLVARLFNAGIKRKALQLAFGVHPTTMRRWGDALRSDDPELLVRALGGRGGPRKYSLEIQSFVRVRFADIYRETPKIYSRRMREEVQEVFGVELSAETLRPLFKELKLLSKRSAVRGSRGARLSEAGSALVEEADDGPVESDDGYCQQEEPSSSPAGAAGHDISRGDVEVQTEAPGLPRSEKENQAHRESACAEPHTSPVGVASEGASESTGDLCSARAETVEGRGADLSHEVRADGGANACEMEVAGLAPQPIVDLKDAESAAALPVIPYRNGSNHLRLRWGPLHHLGVLLFFGVLLKIDERFSSAAGAIKQWLAAILLGAVNIEQSKLLDFEALEVMLGSRKRDLRTQRKMLSALAIQQNVQQLFAFNAELVGAAKESDFYYDPHTKHYTGMKKILKGWISGIRWADKAMHMDFFHTTGGAPVYLEHVDNYEDLRVRIPKQLPRFRQAIGLGPSPVITLIVDRGIFGQEVFASFVSSQTHRLITWEKNYQPASDWDAEPGKRGSLVIQRARNSSKDLKTYRFEYLDQPWSKQAGMRRLRVRATNPKGRTIEVGVLASDTARDAKEIITLIFTRWIQENGFKYLDRHFGMKQITSYADQSYAEIRQTLADKKIKTGAYKALEKRRATIRKKLASLLLRERQRAARQKEATDAKEKLQRRFDAGGSSMDSAEIEPLRDRIRTLAHRIGGLRRAKHDARIAEQEKELRQVEKQMAGTEKEISRLDFLVGEGYVRLDARNKRFMDAIKIVTRNAFYQALQPFKKAYDNYRDDHAYFRNLTQADGWFIEYPDHMEIVLTPTAHLGPKMRGIMEKYLHQITAGAQLPNGSRKPMTLRLMAENETPPWLASANLTAPNQAKS